MADVVYSTGYLNGLVKALHDWTAGGDTYRIILEDSTSTYNPTNASTDKFVSDAVANGFVELPNIAGYTGGYGGSGRKAVGTRAVTDDPAGINGEKLTAANLTWSAIEAVTGGHTVKGWLLVKDITDDAHSLVVAHFTSAGSQALAGFDLSINWGANGVLNLINH